MFSLKIQDYDGLRSSLTLEFYKKAYEHIMLEYPYWNQSSGKDHIWVYDLTINVQLQILFMRLQRLSLSLFSLI